MKVRLLILLFLVFIGCKWEPSRKNCDFKFFEKVSKVAFPKEVEIIDCYDSAEGDIWVHLRFSNKDSKQFMRTLDFHQYQNKVKHIDLDTDKILPYYPDNDAIETFENYMGSKYVPIPKTKNTYINIIRRENQYLTYIMNKESNLFWGYISYPDWSGD